MELSSFAIRIILLFLPGLVSFLIIKELTSHRDPKLHDIFIQSFILGVLCYLVYYAFILLANLFFNAHFICSFFGAVKHASPSLDFKEILIVISFSIPIGLIVSAIINHKLLFKIANRLSISRKYGNVDVWSYIMDATEPTMWVIIRDRENDLAYEGWIEAYDSTEKDEIFLRDVMIYVNSTSKKLYNTPGLYIHKKKSTLLVEFPNLQYSKFIKRPKREEK